MSMTSGATKAVEALMDGAAVVHGVRDELSRALDDVSEAESRVAGLALGVTRADEFLRAALELSDATDRDAMICRARGALGEVRRRSLGNGGPLSRLGDRWLALLARADRAGEGLADLVAAAAGARRARLAVSEDAAESGADWPELAGDVRTRRRRGWRGLAALAFRCAGRGA